MQRRNWNVLLYIFISRNNLHFVLIIGDFNAKSSNWSSNDTKARIGCSVKLLISLWYETSYSRTSTYFGKFY